MSRFTTLTARAAVIGAVTVGLAAGIAGTASAAPPQTAGTQLTIYKPSSGGGKAYVNGVIPMTQDSAHTYIRQMDGFYFQLFGDDDGNNDTVVHTDYALRGASLPGQVPGQYLYAAADGLHFHREFAVTRSELNEDRGVFDNQEDEIYAVATLFDTHHQGRLKVTSNVVVKYF